MMAHSTLQMMVRWTPQMMVHSRLQMMVHSMVQTMGHLFPETGTVDFHLIQQSSVVLKQKWLRDLAVEQSRLELAVQDS